MMQTDRNIKLAALLCLLPAIFLIVSGILLLFMPVQAKALFDLPTIDVLKGPIALSLGIRQLVIGLLITIFSLTNQVKALAYVLVIGALVPLIDFIVFIPTIGVVSALRHLGSVPFILGLGFYLVIQFRKKDE